MSNYIKQKFENGTVLKASHLNHIENGIKTLEEEININNSSASGTLTTNQIQCLNAMFQNCIYDASKLEEHREAYLDFRYAFGLDLKRVVHVTMLDNISFLTTNVLHVEDDCMCAMFNCKQNKNYTVTDTGTHNRFRFYGRLTKDDLSTVAESLPMDNIIADKNSHSGIDSLNTFTFNSGENQTIYIYLVGDDPNCNPIISVVEEVN